MATYTQENRLLSLTSPLGDNVLLLTAFAGREELSRLFHYELELLSEDHAIKPGDLVGKNVTWVVQHLDHAPRYFNGVVSRLSAGPRTVHELRAYRMEVVPWLWFLTRTSDCRIEQHQTTPRIIETVFKTLGFRDFEMSLRATYQPWEYCVQYRETAFNFVTRLMEHEGIFWFFRHQNGKHTLVLADSKSAYRPCAESSVWYTAGTLAPNHIDSWEHAWSFRTGKWAQTDYNFKTPSTKLLTSTDTLIDLPGVDRFEFYDYPGEYDKRAAGTDLTRLRMEEEEVPHDVVQGSSGCCTFTPGGKFTLEEHDIEDEAGKSYVVTRVEHFGSNPSYDSSGGDGGDYHNRFTCIPSSVIFRPERTTRKPLVEGPQTAVVVGPKGEEIYTDEYGRVKVQFHWDRYGKRDENSSCWMRVSQVHAGKKWGGIDLPRVGEEVIVDFLEGDPDRPIITGRVYNAEHMPPIDLPAKKMMSGLKSNTYPGGGGFNQLTMDDTKGQEMLFMNSQYDKMENVNNNRTTTVGVDSAESVGNNVTIQVGNDETETIGNNQTTVVGNKLVITAGTSITLKCGASTIHMNQAGFITISGTVITTAAAANLTMTAPLTEVVGGVMLSAIGGITLVEGGVTHVGGAKLTSVTSGGQLDVVAAADLIAKGATIKLNS